MKLIQKSFLILLLAGLASLVSMRVVFPNGANELVEGARVEASGSQSLPIALDRSVPIPVRKPQVVDPDILARAVLVKDYDSGLILLEKNRNQLLPIASLTKLMTAIVAKKALPFNEVVEIKPEDLKIPTYRADFIPGEKVTVKNLIEAMLVSSANDAAMALARIAGGGNVQKFVAEMNAEARRLGMRQTSFANPVGLDDSGHYSTAVDLAKLVEEFLRYPELLEIVGKKSAVIQAVNGKGKYFLTTTNKLMISNPEVIGLKTGYTDEARGNLIIFADLARSDVAAMGKYYSIILGSEDREREMKTVMNWIRENYQWPK